MKILILLSLLFTSAPIYAQESTSCWPVYEAEEKKINEENGYTTHVGGQLYVHNGQLGYWPGIKVQADIDNYAEDLIRGIKWGPMIMFSSKEDPRLEMLKAMKKDISKDCPLKHDNSKHDILRSMLTELMDDGSFCPQGKPLKLQFFSRWKNFRKILKDAVGRGQFQGQCLGVAVMDSTQRDVKDVSGESGAQRESGKAQAR